MSPQRRGVVPPETAERLLAARDRRDEAAEEYRAEMLAARRTGASYRELANLTGTALSTIQQWEAQADRDGS